MPGPNPSKTMSGARAMVSIVDPNTGVSTIVGIFNNFSYGLTYNVQPVYVLGRYSAAELDYTSMEPVQCTASGWRIVGHGPHNLGPTTGTGGAPAGVPKLNDLLTHNYIELQVFDRQTGARVAVIHNVRPTGYTTTVTARQLQEVTVSFVGLLLDDETNSNDESVGAVSLP